MLEDKGMLKFIWTFLGVISIMVDGPIIPLVCSIIAIAVLVYKIKCAKEDPAVMQDMMFEIFVLVIVLIITIPCFIMRIAIVSEFDSSDYKSSSVEEEKVYTSEEIAEMIIDKYKRTHDSYFNTTSNKLNEIKSGFELILRDYFGDENVTVNNNKMTCSYLLDEIVFTVTRNDITYVIK